MKHITLDGGIRTGIFKLPPPGFDPFKASAADLKMYGLPQLPSDPGLLARYRRVFPGPSGSIKWIEPQFTLGRGWVRRPRPKRVALATEEGTSWSGGIVAGAFRWMMGDWIVPNVGAVVDGRSMCGVWIGLDGDGQMQDGQQVFQAGVVITVNRSGNSVQTKFEAFWEWFPDDAVIISNFEVNPGDLLTLVLCSAQGTGSTEGTAFFANRTTGFGLAVPMFAPAGTALRGATAEWIVEMLTDRNTNQLIPLPDYGEVFFSECIAVSTDGSIVGGGTGNNYVAFDTQGNLVSQGQLIAPTVVQCLYSGDPPA
jgi:hypothetical protein